MVNEGFVRDDSPSDKRSSFVESCKVVWFLLQPHLPLYSAVLFLSLLDGALGGLTIACLFPVFDALSGSVLPANGRLFHILNQLSAHLVVGRPIVGSGILLMIIATFKSLCGWGLEVLMGYASAKVNFDLGRQILERYMQGGYPFIIEHKQGELVYNLYGAPLRVSSLFSFLPTMASQVFNIAALVVLLLSINVQATLFFLGGGFVFQWVTAYVSRRFIYPIGKAKKNSQIDQYVMINEFINGFKQIAIFNAASRWKRYHEEITRRFMTLTVQETKFMATPKNFWEFLFLIVGACVMIYVGLNPRQASPGASVASFGVYLVAVQRILPYLSNLGRYRMSVASFFPDAKIAYNTLHWPLPSRSGATQSIVPLREGVRFENVGFSYPGRSALLNRANLFFERGKTTAVVGASGAGKTTILNMMLGLFGPTEGRILIDGVSLADIELSMWLNQIGFVSQDNFIFHASIRDNILFSREATQGELEEAAILANAHTFITEFPDGYETIVGDRGMKLSGGQQQRVALARAILAKPSIVILDEATSSLDTVSEGLIQDAMRKISINRTVIVVAHRLSTIMNADKILVMKDGQVVEEGSHSELMGRQDYYYRLQSGHSPQETASVNA